MLTLKRLVKTCRECPSQWEGRTVDDVPVYIRYRWGTLRVKTGIQGGEIGTAYNGTIIFEKKIGDDLDGSLDVQEMLSYTQSIFCNDKLLNYTER